MAQATRADLMAQNKQQQVSTTANFNGAKTKVAARTQLKPTSESVVATNTHSKPSTTTTTSASSKTKPSYKHIPHSQKPPHLVAKRNARERRRVQAVNQAFYKLRRCVPIQNRNKRVSKVKTLQRAIDYIRDLQAVLAEDDAAQAAACNGNGGQSTIQRGPSTSSNGRLLVSSQAGDEAEMRLAMSPEPVESRTKRQKAVVQAASKEADSAAQKPKRGRKPQVKRPSEVAAAAPLPRVALAPTQQQQQHPNQNQISGYLIEPAGGFYAPSEQPIESYNGRDTSGGSYYQPAVYAYQRPGEQQQQQQHYHYASAEPQQQSHYYSHPAAFHQHEPQEHHEQLYHHHQQPAPPLQQQQQHSYSSHHQQHFYQTLTNHQQPYGTADSTSHAAGRAGDWQQPVPSSGQARNSSGSAAAANQLAATQLALNSSLDSNSTSAQCLYNGRRVSMPADSTSSANNTSCSLNTSGSSTKSSTANSLIHSPYSTASSASNGSSGSNGSSTSTASTSTNASSHNNNKSLDASAPLDLKSKAAASAGGRQVNSDNNYASSYAHVPPPPPPNYLYEQHQLHAQNSHKSSARATAANQQAQVNGAFVCGGERSYLAQEQPASMHEIGYHQHYDLQQQQQQRSFAGNADGKSNSNFDGCAHLMADDLATSAGRPLGAYAAAPTSLM